MESQTGYQNQQYVNADFEAHLKEIRECLLIKAESLGVENGLGNQPHSVQEHCALIIQMIETGIQQAIYSNELTYLPGSGWPEAKIVETEAQKQTSLVQNSIHDDKQSLKQAVYLAQSLQPDLKLISYRNFAMVCVVFMGFYEGVTSYSPLRYAQLQPFNAFVASIAIALGAGFIAHFGGGYIKEAQSTFKKRFYYMVIMFFAIVGFYGLACLRAKYYNHHVDFDVSNSETNSELYNNVSALIIATISILLFWISLFLSIRFFRTEAVRLQESAYVNKCKEVEKIEKDIQEKNDLISNIQKNKVERMTGAIKRFEHAITNENLLVNYAQELAEAYKQKNIRHRTDGIPAFYAQKPQFNFIRLFNNVKPWRNEND